MKVLNKTMKFIALLLIILTQFIFISVPKAYAATSPDLGAAGSFSVLGGETVTNTGSSTIAGDLGVSPGSEVTGFPPGIVTLPYTIHAADTVAHDAQIVNSAAFGSLDQGCTETYAGIKDLVGLTLVPGVYCAGAFELSGTLTLSGLSTDVWIFKSASTLITSGTAEVVGPPDACYVWWRVVSSATLGTGTKFIGNILASTSITLATGASLLGRAFAYTGAVTLDNNTIGAAICLAPPAPTPTATPTPEVTPTPTPAPTSEVTPTPTPQVLGALTEKLAVTGSNDQFVRSIIAATAALLVFLLGQALLRRNETS